MEAYMKKTLRLFGLSESPKKLLSYNFSPGFV